MTELRVSVNVEDVEALTEEQRDRLENLGPAWEAIGAITIQAIHRNVREEGAHFGNPWAPLSSFTREVKGREGGMPLRDTGRMLGTLHAEVHPEGVTISNRLPGAADRDVKKGDWHQRGFFIPPQSMRGVAAWFHRTWNVRLTKAKMQQGIEVPARPWFPVTDDDVPAELVERAEAILSEYVESGIPEVVAGGA